MKTAARNIRFALKAHGYSSKDVSVRVRGCAVDCTIRNTTTNPATVREIASKNASVDRCNITGEILGGGNVYTTVRYETGVLEAYYGDLPAQLEAGESVIFGDWTCYADDTRPGFFRAFNPGTPGLYCFGARHLATQLAEKVLSS